MAKDLANIESVDREIDWLNEQIRHFTEIKTQLQLRRIHLENTK